MRILIAPDSFKESLSALEVATAIEKGFKAVLPNAEYLKVPMADGGEGTALAVLAATAGTCQKVKVKGPLEEEVDSFFGLTGDGKTAIIEMAAASGLELVKVEKRNPLLTTSFGTGQLIKAALDLGVRHLVLGLGGSATNDAGAGLLMALGVRLLDQEGNLIAPTGAGLAKLSAIDLTDLDPRLKDCVLEIACDVDNPLTGPKGASYTFGPQKGASQEQVMLLDANLKHFAQIVRQSLGLDMENLKGAGAAGGMGGALWAFLGGKLRSGLSIVAEVVGLYEKIAKADLVITGEGRLDAQTLHGKTPAGIARIAAEYKVPVLALGGSLSDDADQVLGTSGFAAIQSAVARPCELKEALKSAKLNLEKAAQRAAHLLCLGAQLKSKLDES
ncbi:MAG: glycerate kinase [Desulfovibrio sp.]|nr:glycerate kinase [Desulfovibrio sp.]